jgi:hypothetical protein
LTTFGLHDWHRDELPLTSPFSFTPAAGTASFLFLALSACSRLHTLPSSLQSFQLLWIKLHLRFSLFLGAANPSKRRLHKRLLLVPKSNLQSITIVLI